MPYQRRSTNNRGRGPQRPHSGGGIGGGGIFLIFILFVLFFNILDSVFYAIGPLLPIIFLIVVIAIATRSSNKNNKSTKTTRSKATHSTKRKSHDRKAIDTKLAAYFKDSYRLPVYDDIYLTTKNGVYSGYEDLLVTKGEEVIMSLGEFADRFPVTADEVISLLEVFARQKQETAPAPALEPSKLSQAQQFISDINDLNVDIQKEEIKSGLYQTCALLKQIDTGASPEDNEKIYKLYDYYLPILVKILRNYKNLSAISRDSKDFKECEDQLIKTLVLINEALKIINESIYEDDYMDLSADITTLQSLLKKDGLVRNGTIYEEGNDGQDQ